MTAIEAVRRVQVYGSTKADGDGGFPIDLSPKQRNLLALLVAAGPDGLTTEQLLDEMADGERTKSAQSRVRMDLSRLRGRLGDDAIPPGRGRWRLAMAPDAVDHFSLVARADGEVPSANDLLRLLSGVAFRESAQSPLIQAALHQTTAARRSLLADVSELRPELLTPIVLDAVRRLVAADPLDDGLAAVAIEAHLVAGARADARTVLDLVERSFAEHLPGTTPALGRDLRRRVLGDGAEPAPRATVRPPMGESDAFVGRAEEIAALRTWLDAPTSAAVVVGVSGAGKSRLLAETVSHAEAAGRRILAISGHESARAAFGPWREAMPGLADTIRRFGSEQHPDDRMLANARLWDEIRDALVIDGERTLLVLDDAQWLDSPSQDLAQFLIRTAGADLQVLVAGRPTAALDDWAALQATAEQAGGPTIELRGLTIGALEDLISELRPESRLSVRAQFAREVLDGTDGLPAVARLIIESAEGAALQHATVRMGSALAPVLQGLTPDQFHVALVLAVLSPGTDWATLVDLSGRRDAHVLAAVDALVERGIATFSERADRPVGLAHVLYRDAVVELASASTVRRLHREAADLATSIHRRAHHQFLAHPLVDGATSSESLLESASAHAHDGAFREAIHAFHRAQLRRGDEPFPISSLIEWAAALDRTGLPGSRVRADAVARALTADEPELALDAALSGLPEAETGAGDPQRIDLLLALEPERLSTARRFDHAHATGRQLAVAGRVEEADRWLAAASDLAENRDQLDQLTRARWLAGYSRTSHPERIEGDFHSEDDVPIPTRHLRSVDLLGSGRLDDAMRLDEALADELLEQPNPFISWHLQLHRATCLLSAGRLTEANQASGEAFLHGVRYGLREAGSAWLAQVAMSVWMQRGAAELVPQMSAAAGDISESMLAESMFALALADAGQLDRAEELADDLAGRALEHRSFTGVASLLLLSRVLGDRAPTSAAARDLLQPLAGSLLVTGGGFACIGPVEMGLGFLSSRESRHEHFDSAIALVDRLGVRGWQIATRLEVARSFGDADRRREAADLAAGLGWVLDAPGS